MVGASMSYRRTAWLCQVTEFGQGRIRFPSGTSESVRSEGVQQWNQYFNAAG